MPDEQQTRRQFEEERRQEQQQRIASAGLALAAAEGTRATALAASKRATAQAGEARNPERERYWQTLWDGGMHGLWAFFVATSETIIMPLLLAPFLFAVDLFRLVGVNIFNKGRPLRFPLFGLVDLETPGHKFPGGVLAALFRMTCMGGITILEIVLIGFLIFMIMKTCGELGICDLLPKMNL